MRPPLKARRSAERLLTSAPRRAPATLTWYFAGAGLLAVAATAGLVALEQRSAAKPSTATRAEAPAAGPATRPSPTTPAPKPVAAAKPAPSAPAPPIQASPPAAPAPTSLAAAPRPAPLASVAPPPPPPAPPAQIPPPASAPSTALALAPSPAPPPLPDPARTATLSQPAPLPSPPPPALPAAPAPPAAVASTAAAPTACLPDSLKAILAELATRFQGVTVVSTTTLRTDNHSPGTAREKMHGDCRAVDFKTSSPVAEVTAYLRSRKEIAGINSYRNGLIHIDVNEGGAGRAASRPAPARRRAAAGEPMQLLGAPPQAPDPSGGRDAGAGQTE